MLTINNDFLNIVADILKNPKFEELKSINHHGECNNVYQHSIKTAYFAYRFSLACGLSREEVISTTRTTLLHDFYDTNWRYAKRTKLFEMHAFKHGDVAAKNAKKHFNITSKETDAIKNHMFPLTTWPHHKVGWILTLSDKVISTKEMCEACIYYLSSNKQKTKIIKNNSIKIK